MAIALLPAILTGNDHATAASPESTRVRSFAEVQAGPFEFERDPTDPTRGIFRVETTEPMICAIVWGDDRSFGRFNNSLSMNGTGIVDHDVVLPDVEPNVRYSFVVQGTTADGTLYRSDVGAFRLRAAPSVRVPRSVAGLDNVTVRASVLAVSSEHSDAFAAEHAIDDDTSTEWATKADGNRGSVTLDLGAQTEVEAVEFVTRAMADGSAVTSRYDVTLDDATKVGPFRAGTVARPRPAAVGMSARVIRFDVSRSTGGNVGAVEIRVYAKA